MLFEKITIKDLFKKFKSGEKLLINNLKFKVGLKHNVK